jgi:replicative DNA helicase
VFREIYYLERERQPDEKLQALLQDPRQRDKWLKWMADVERARGKAEVIVAKRRRGPIGSALLAFEEALTRSAPSSYSAQPSTRPTAGLKAPRALSEHQQRLHERIAP